MMKSKLKKSGKSIILMHDFQKVASIAVRKILGFGRGFAFHRGPSFLRPRFSLHSWDCF